MIDRLTDVVSLLEYIEELLETLSTDGRLLLYTRDLTRLVAWLRTQPRSRAIMLGTVGAGLLMGVVLLSTYREPAAAGQWPRANLPAEPEEWQDPP